ncbi:hypothetical protein [Streptosporangium canum]|uniref:hypothetical protein n=1 Tax=Streptosporangium canum TaxID=324952 RepID=UPI003412884E
MVVEPVTGDLTIRTEVYDDQATVGVQYTGAEEWYGVEGGPLPVAAGAGRQLHQMILEGVKKGLPDGLAGVEARYLE